MKGRGWGGEGVGVKGFGSSRASKGNGEIVGTRRNEVEIIGIQIAHSRKKKSKVQRVEDCLEFVGDDRTRREGKSVYIYNISNFELVS